MKQCGPHRDAEAVVHGAGLVGGARAGAPGPEARHGARHHANQHRRQHCTRNPAHHPPHHPAPPGPTPPISCVLTLPLCRSVPVMDWFLWWPPPGAHLAGQAENYDKMECGSTFRQMQHACESRYLSTTQPFADREALEMSILIQQTSPVCVTRAHWAVVQNFGVNRYKSCVLPAPEIVVVVAGSVAVAACGGGIRTVHRICGAPRTVGVGHWSCRRWLNVPCVPPLSVCTAPCIVPGWSSFNVNRPGLFY